MVSGNVMRDETVCLVSNSIPVDACGHTNCRASTLNTNALQKKKSSMSRVCDTSSEVIGLKSAMVLIDIIKALKNMGQVSIMIF